MANFFASMLLVCFLGAVVCYFATDIAIRKLMPEDASWLDVQTLGSFVWEHRIPVLIRRLYLSLVCLMTLGMICGVPLALIHGGFAGILFAIVGIGWWIYRLYWLWFNYYREF